MEQPSDLEPLDTESESQPIEPAEETVHTIAVRQRRRARALALQTLYESDLTGHRAGDVLRRLSSQLHANPDAYDYAREIISGVISNLADIDGRIASRATVWPVDQMPGIDRNLLRIGIFEALFNSPKIPVAVAINEAVELAKLYGTESSARLIHGVLGKVIAESPSAQFGSEP